MSNYLYHYTDEAGVKAICKSGKILMSLERQGDAVYGDGVYLTALSPDTSTYVLIANNWDDAAIQERGNKLYVNATALAKTRFCFAIPKASIPEVKKMSDKNGRDIWLYPKELILAGKGVQVHARE